MEDNWQSIPATAHNGHTVIVSTDPSLVNVRNAGKHHFRVEVSLDYEALPDGMPTDESAELLDTITEAFKKTLVKDKAVVLSELFTGDGRRDWIFRTTSLFIFQKVFNRALEPLPLYPFLIEAEDDPEWQSFSPLPDD